MAGPKEEWLIWDKRFQFGYSCLSQRLKTMEEAMQQIARLDQQTKELAVNSKRLQEDNDGLRDRIRQLEQTSDQIAQLDEQVKDLTASSRYLKEENNALYDRILQLEQEDALRDQKSRLVQEQLNEKLSAQDGELKSVVAAMSEMNYTARAERGHREEEIQQLRSRFETLVTTRHTSEGHALDASREMTQATTEDERMLQPNAHEDIEVQDALIKLQASFLPFEDHLRFAEEAFRRSETEAVRKFVSSTEEAYRVQLSKMLEERREWTWQAVREEGFKIVEARKKTKRRSPRLLAGASKPS